GKQAGQIGPEHRRELTEHHVVVDDAAGAQRIDPRSERQHLLGLVRARREDPKSPSGRQRCELVQEPALADAGLTNEGDDPELSGTDLVEQRVEFRRLVLSPQQRDCWVGPGGYAAAGVRGRGGESPTAAVRVLDRRSARLTPSL